MGQILTTTELKTVVDANRDAYIAQVTGSYSRLFGRSPTFVTYYSIDQTTGSTDLNLGGGIQFIGPESPLRFRKISDFPLYGISEADVTTNYEELEGAVSSNIGGEAFVLPGSIEPVENDVFVIEHLGTPLAFRVKSADPAYLEGKTFFKLGYFMDSSNPAYLARQVSGDYAFELRNVGSGFTPVIEAPTALALSELAAVEEAVRRAYWRAFYAKSSSALLLRVGYPYPVHDRALDLFVARNDLLSSDTYLGSRNVVPADYGDLGEFEDLVYPATVFSLAERGIVPTAASPPPAFLMMVATAPYTPASPFYEEFAVASYLEAVPSGGGLVWPGGADLIARAESGNLAGAGPMLALAARCLGGTLRGLPARDGLHQLADALNDTAILGPRPDFFWLCPLAFMESKRLQKAALRTTN